MLRTPLRIAAVTALAFAGLAVGSSAPAGITDTVTETVTLGCTGAPVEWVVPAGVTSIDVEISGAAGGRGDLGLSGSAVSLGADGGLGGTTTGTIATTPGETLVFTVGCVGADSDGSSAAGGFGGSPGGPGGDAGTGGAGGGGGGSTDVRQGGSGLAHRVLVAGGGGGSGGNNAFSCGADDVIGQCGLDASDGGPDVSACEVVTGDGHGGDGGGETGADGDGDSCELGGGGGGGTQSAGGAGGLAFGCYGDGDDPGDAGTDASGGAGGSAEFGASGGGGGGGWFGGGGGGACLAGGGGGGGSGHGGSMVTGLVMTAEVNPGDGRVVITYTVAGPEAVVADPTFTG